MTDDGISFPEQRPPYGDNAALLADLRRFVESLLAQAHGDASGGFRGIHPEPSAIWRAIAARMAASVNSNVFIPLAHVAIIFQLDARDLQLLTLSLLAQTDRAIGAALFALSRELQEGDWDDDVGSPDPARSAHVSLIAATRLLGDIRASLFADSPLCERDLIELVDVNVSAMTGSYQLVQTVTAYLLGLAAPQPRIGDHLCVDVPADDGLDGLIVEPSVRRQLLRFVDICSTTGDRYGTVVLHIETDDATLGGALAAATFAELGYGVTQLDARHLRWAYEGDGPRMSGLARQVRLACRDAALCTQVLMVANVDSLMGDKERDQPDLFDSIVPLLLEASTYLIFLNGSARQVAGVVSNARRQGARLFRVHAGELSVELRRQAWLKHASHRNLPIGDSLLSLLTGAYAFTEARIATVVDTAAGRYALIGGDTPESLLWETCRVEAEDHPVRVAKRVETPYRFHDLVAPDRTIDLLRETLGQMQYRPQVMGAWGFGSKYPSVANLCALFHGPPGTGKTMAASIIANELSLPLYRVDISAVLSKYIGETEQNIERLFVWAEKVNVVLLFDEADGFFSKRTETKDSNDRFANMQIGFLLQRIESYPGLVVLSTNLMSNMDKAFLRRIHFTVEFPFPTAEDRLRLWRQIFPEQVPLDPDVDFSLLAEKASLSGGHIRNAAVSAAFLAARDGTSVKMTHVVSSVAREYEKLGKLFAHGDF